MPLQAILQPQCQQMDDEQRVHFEPSQATAILRSLGIGGVVSVRVVHEFNHVYRFEAGGEAFFLKTHTKAWYRGNPQAPAACVQHEQAAWQILGRHGLPTPEIVRVAADADNEFGRPFILTRELRGAPLTTLLDPGDASSRQLLVAV